MCSICLQDVQAGEQSYTLPACGHAFHTECIVAWFRSHQTRCPLCNNAPRNPRNPGDDEDDDDDDNVYVPESDLALRMRIIKAHRGGDPVVAAELRRLKKLEVAARAKAAAYRQLCNTRLSETLSAGEDVTLKQAVARLNLARSKMYHANWRVLDRKRALARFVPVVSIVLPARAPPPRQHAMQLRPQPTQ
jgi:hypothetical protein